MYAVEQVVIVHYIYYLPNVLLLSTLGRRSAWPGKGYHSFRQERLYVTPGYGATAQHKLPFPRASSAIYGLRPGV